MKKSLTFWNIFPVSLIIFGVLLLIFRYLIKQKQQVEETEDVEAEEMEEEPADEPTKEARIIDNYKIIRGSLPDSVPDEFIKILTAQAIHETGFFTSKLYIENNNMFGMTQPVIRETLSIGQKDGFANFTSLEDSVKDMLLYLKEFKLKPNYKEVKDYVKDIREKGYFTDTYLNYFNAMRSHLTKVKATIQ